MHGGSLDDEYNSKRKRQRLLRAATVHEHISSIQPGLVDGSIHPIDGAIVFPAIDTARVLQPHRDALILTLGVGDFDVKRILVDLGSSANLLQVSVVKQMGFIPFGLENPGRILSRFNGSSITSLGDVILLVQAGPVILNTLFSVVEELFPFNAILGHMWLHGIKVIPSTYHQLHHPGWANRSSRKPTHRPAMLSNRSRSRTQRHPRAQSQKKQTLPININYSTRRTRIPRQQTHWKPF